MERTLLFHRPHGRPDGRPPFRCAATPPPRDGPAQPAAAGRARARCCRGRRRVELHRRGCLRDLAHRAGLHVDRAAERRRLMVCTVIQSTMSTIAVINHGVSHTSLKKGEWKFCLDRCKQNLSLYRALSGKTPVLKKGSGSFALTNVGKIPVLTGRSVAKSQS